MTVADEGDLSRGERRRFVARALLVPAVASVVLVVLYYTLPMDHFGDAATMLRLVVGLLILAVIVFFQVRAVLRARFPGLRAITTAGVVLPLYVLIFASTYYLLALHSPSSFDEPLSRTDALYFSTTVFATVGFGDIAARSEPARLVVTGHMLLDLVVLGAGVRLLATAARIRRQEQSHVD